MNEMRLRLVRKSAVFLCASATIATGVALGVVERTLHAEVPDAGVAETSDAESSDARADDAAVGDAGSPGADAADGGSYAVGFADAAAVFVPAAHPSDDGVTGLWFAFRGGYGVPFGQNASVNLSDIVTGSIHFGAEAGYAFSPQLYVGGYFDYGVGVVQYGAGATCPNDPENISGCSADQFRFGLIADWHFRPTELLDPWAGVGVGYDVFNLTATSAVDGSTALSSALNGFEGMVRAGIDIKPAKSYGFGPFIEGTLGVYETNVHGWFNFGLRIRSRLLL